MQSGEDIMASMIENEDDTIELNDPMRLVFRRLPTGQTIMMMMPWLPIELIQVNSAKVYTSDIITMVEPKAAMIEYYGKLVTRLLDNVADSDEMLQGLLEQHDEDENEEPKYEAELQEFLQEFKSKKLH